MIPQNVMSLSERKAIQFTSIVDEYIRLEESNSIILAMNKVDEIVNGEIMKDIYDYLKKIH